MNKVFVLVIPQHLSSFLTLERYLGLWITGSCFNCRENRVSCLIALLGLHSPLQAREAVQNPRLCPLPRPSCVSHLWVAWHFFLSFLLSGVIFNSSLGHRHIRSAHRKLPPHVTYTIRTNVLYSMRTDLIKYPSWKFHPQNLPADGFKYNYIFVPLQDIIERAIIAVQTGQEAVEPMTQAQAAPYPCHTSDLWVAVVSPLFL